MWFINREEELKRLKEGLLRGESFVLTAPRRFGKTTLIKRVFEELRDAYKVFYIDLMPYSGDEEALMEYMLEVFYKGMGLAGTVKKMVGGISLRARVVFEELGIEIDLSGKKSSPLVRMSKVLEIPQIISEKENRRVVVAYDEFGELYKAQELVKLFRSVIQHHKGVSYIFSGSQESIMEKVFLSKDGAFFRFGTLVELGALNLGEVLKFAENTLSLLPHAITFLQWLEGHPYYTSRYLQKLNTGKDALESFEELLSEEMNYVELLVEKAKVTKHAIEVLRAIARGENPYKKLNIKSQMVTKVLEKLRLNGLLRRRERGKYEITDPILKGYLSGELNP
ncbi:MAG: ATP-binding protein [Aquificaceae bacterium]|nr:ATP-binding protein [Aquificaceae bacterium]MCS7307947.1 ATP-binding protein [Aquificaceae bacterium]MCX7989669.1 ATP-binding protein [Aquificaceae bacterium]MDW8294953.1 ATP-binding protein [Aquificaceae bacterium]